MSGNGTYQVLIRQTVASRTDQLQNIRQIVEDEALRFGFDADTAFRIALATDEACTNIIKHSYANFPGNAFELSIATERDLFIVVLTDSGDSYDPVKHSTVNMQDYLREMRHGGLGVHIIKLVMDDIQYIVEGNGKRNNELRLIKRLPVAG